MTLIERNRARRIHIIRPPIFLRASDIPQAQPRRNSASFATGMGQLYSNLLALRVCELYDLAERLDLRVFPDSTVFGCDASFWDDGCGFDECDARPALDYAAEVGEVPCCLVAVIGGVLAEGGELVSRFS